MRKRASGLLAAAVLQASIAHGLGLGDITLRSALDEPLDADIRIRNTGELGPTQILVNLGSAEDFDRVGAERSFFLTEFDFSVELDGKGNGVVRVTTDNPIREPYLDFVLEVRWPNGRVLREYTVLLDLPVYDREPSASAVVAPPVETAPAVQERPRARAERAAPAMPGGSAGSWSGDEYGPVQSQDTLWSIASRVSPSDVSVQRMMIGLQRANPRAFIGGNVNLIKAGYVLRVPDAAMLADITQDVALAELAEHERAWRTGEPINRQTPALVSPDVDAASAEDEAYLKLAGDEAGEGATAAGGESADGALQEQVAVANESLAAAARENEELRTRLEALEAQVEDYQRLVALQSDAGAAAQDNASEQAAEPEKAAPAEPAPASAAVSPEPGFLESLLNNTLALVIAAGVLLLGGVLVLLKRRRTDDAFDYGPLPETVPLKATQAPVKASVIAAATAPETEPAQQAPSADAVEPEPTDPVAEAEIYIAYGRIQKARDMLNAALEQDPDRAEARLKLMEIHIDEGDQDGFLAEYAELERRGDNGALAQASGMLEVTGLDWLGSSSAADELASTWSDSGGTEAAEMPVAEAVVDEASLGELELNAEFGDGDGTADDEDPLADLDLGDLELDELALADQSPDPVHYEASDNGLGLDGLGDFDDQISAAPATDDELGEPVFESVSDDGLDFLDDGDAVQTQLELAQAYMDMGDAEGAREILMDVQRDGNDEQRRLAADLLATLGH